MQIEPPRAQNRLQTLFASPFRIFFLLVGLYGVAVVLAWVAFLFGGLSLPLGWSPLHWHSHEMLFGFTAVAIAGFILTAVSNWTNSPPVHGWRWMLLAMAWLAGRVVMWLAGYLPLELVAAVDMVFLLALAAVLLTTLIRHGNRRNLPLGGIILLFAAANFLMHLGFIWGDATWLQHGELFAMNLVALIMVIIGGRIIPLFSGNWLRNKNIPLVIKTWPIVDRACIVTTALIVPVAWIMSPWLTGAVALTAAFFNGWRLYGWQGMHMRREPLLWVLHVGYAWIVAALLLKGLSALELVPPASWQHALGTGAMGTLILGIMTRVALGHTGRSFQLPSYGWSIYAAISLAALFRVGAALGWIDYRLGIMLAATGWCLAFLIFIAIYWSILSRSRLDGRSG